MSVCGCACVGVYVCMLCANSSVCVCTRVPCKLRAPCKFEVQIEGMSPLRRVASMILRARMISIHGYWGLNFLFGSVFFFDFLSRLISLPCKKYIVSQPTS